jgi:hypothetical protein
VKISTILFLRDLVVKCLIMGEIEKQPTQEEIVQALMDFNDPGVIVTLFRQLGWSYTFEIQETIKCAKQNANLSIKLKAIKHLRELLKEAAETSGYIANVSSSKPNADGGHTTLHAKRVVGLLNPTKRIESTEVKESENDQKEQTESDRGSDRGPSQEKSGTDTNSIFTTDEYNAGSESRDGEIPNPKANSGSESPSSVESGGIESSGRGTLPECRNSGGDRDGDANSETSSETNSRSVTETERDCPSKRNKIGESGDDSSNSPCIKHRPPTCDHDLYPGISASAD